MKTSKIKAIRKINCEETPVYDIGVPKYNNFVLANGLVVHNCKPYQYFKTTIYERRLEIYDDKVLKSEVTDLERNMDTGKVDHPDGGAKDKADAVCGAIFNASKHAEEFAYDYGESSEQLLRVNTDIDLDTKQQLTLNLEEELKNLNGVLGIGSGKRVHPSDLNEKTSDYTLFDDIIIL